LISQQASCWIFTRRTPRRLTTACRQTKLVSHNPDFMSILNVGGKIFSVTQFESPRPGVAYLAELEQDAKTGQLTVMHVDVD